MPIKRIIYTLQDIKELLAEKNNIAFDSVDVYEHSHLRIEPFADENLSTILEPDSFLFQVDLDN